MKFQKKKSKHKNERQKEIYIAGVVMGVMIFSMLAYFIYFEADGKEDVLVNPLNNRTANMAQSVRKGDIITSDNVVVATTQNAEDGTEYRLYPFNQMFAHTIGYAQLGGLGLEGTQKINLLTCHNNFIEQMKNELLGVKNTGDTLVTTLDYGLQKYCYDLLGGRSGAIIVMEPKTGKIRAMVSAPDFNPNTISDEWNFIVSEQNTTGNLMNRASMGLYPPGSTFKLITLLEYIRENPDTWEDFHYTCNGSYTNGEYTMNCHEGESHGEVDIYSAFAKSCNGAFDKMAEELDKNKWQKLAEDFGYNEKFTFEFPSVKSSFDIEDDDSVWSRMQLAIGQGTTNITPLMNLLMFCAVANDGVMMKPYLIDQYRSTDGEIIKETQPQSLKTVCSSKEAALLNEFLIKVVTEGTAPMAGISQCQVAGKSGSAQFSSAAAYHSWFCGYAPADDPEIAVCVLVEAGGAASVMASPAAGNIFNYYFSR